MLYNLMQQAHLYQEKETRLIFCWDYEIQPLATVVRLIINSKRCIDHLEFTRAETLEMHVA